MIGGQIAQMMGNLTGDLLEGIGKLKGTQAKMKALGSGKVMGAGTQAVLTPIAGGVLARAMTGQTLSRADIAPQITAAEEQAGETQRGLLTSLQAQGGIGGTSISDVSRLTGSVARERTRTLRDVFAEQAMMNAQARQQAAGQALSMTAGQQQSQLRWQRGLIRGQLLAEEQTAYYDTAAKMNRSAGQAAAGGGGGIQGILGSLMGGGK